MNIGSHCSVISELNTINYNNNKKNSAYDVFTNRSYNEIMKTHKTLKNKYMFSLFKDAYKKNKSKVETKSNFVDLDYILNDDYI